MRSAAAARRDLVHMGCLGLTHMARTDLSWGGRYSKLREFFSMGGSEKNRETITTMIKEVFEVSPDTTQGDVRKISPADLAAIQGRVCRPIDAVRAALLLVRVGSLPASAAEHVLAFANVFPAFSAETRRVHGGTEYMNEVYLELRIPRFTHAVFPGGIAITDTCVGLIVECESKDQGWNSSHGLHYGTYNASHTWSEVAVGTVGEDGSVAEVARQVIVPNVRAHWTARHHVKQFRDPDGLITHVKPGSVVQLILRSQYAGWTNTASFGRIRAQFALKTT